ncbi:fluoride efflux transporter CrcB [Allosphingosinicella indica]|uniref:Fluoride-specific ion channel FluC n=1 Tax=Allosphingosinicella indica TaxID=941907 RepID=A0A1X7H3Z2_9SPHN|nr:fluoride efflux transporter CrcB [Allosphingosinicella indica]SMF78807.1 camphor resistance protein CrcB [Allosphingosinicella indica]
MPYLLVFFGGGLGAVLRYIVGRGAIALFGPAWPVGTFAVNVIGSVALGLLAGWFVGRGIEDEPIRLLLATGFLGGFTTFSAFSLDAVLLWQRGDTAAATLYVAASVAVSLAGLALGLWITSTP